MEKNSRRQQVRFSYSFEFTSNLSLILWMLLNVLLTHCTNLPSDERERKKNKSFPFVCATILSSYVRFGLGLSHVHVHASRKSLGLKRKEDFIISDNQFSHSFTRHRRRLNQHFISLLTNVWNSQGKRKCVDWPPELVVHSKCLFLLYFF